MRVAVIGTGYVGLVAGTCFAETGNNVTCVDIDPAKVAKLNEGTPTIFEPGLKELMNKNQQEDRLIFTTNLKTAIENCDVIFLAVGTPSSVDGSADLTAVLKVAGDIGSAMNGKKVIVNKSTVPVGTAQKVHRAIAAQTKHPFHIVSNPEFLKEGSALDDFLRPDRVVIGTDSDEAWNVMKELYEPFVRQGNPIIRMSNVSAEMTKYAANAMLATKISFINEVAQLCDRVGADVESVRAGITSDIRIGRHFLYPGPGYGGSCFPKDVKALLKTGKESGLPMYVVEAAEKAYESQINFLGEKIEKHFGGASALKGKVIALWGLSFKPNTDDMREAPSRRVIADLLARGASVCAYDPVAMDEARRIFGAEARMAYAESPMAALDGADALVIVTEWKEFRSPDFGEMKRRLKAPLVFDGRNLYDPSQMRAAGIQYFAIGRQ